MNEANGFKFSYEPGKEDLVLIKKRRVPEGVRVRTNVKKMSKFEDWIERNNN